MAAQALRQPLQALRTLGKWQFPVLTARADSGQQPRWYIRQQQKLRSAAWFFQTLEQSIGRGQVHGLGRGQHNHAMTTLLSRLGDEGVNFANGVDTDLALALFRRNA